MAKSLTDIAIQRLKPGEARREIADIAPLLYVLVQPTGRKRFALRYRFNGQSRKITLAPGLSLAAARKDAADAALDLDRGIDPREARKAAKGAAAGTLRSICAQYLAREGDWLRTRHQRELLLARHVYPTLGERPIGAIRRGEIVRLLDQIEDKSGSRSADAALTAIRTVFHWWMLRDEDFVPPTVRGMARHSTAAHARSRILDDGELRRVWKACEAADYLFGAIVRFLLLTGARCNEAVAMTWDEIANGVWLLPAGRNKTKQELARPLSCAALAIIEAQPRFDGVPFVFAAGSRPQHVWRPKVALDAATGVTGWRIHDLRRTARSLMSRAGANADVAERCLGHVISGVRGTYDRHRYQAEMLAAYEQLAAQIERILDPQPNIVPLRKGKADA
jgi:integrase